MARRISSYSESSPAKLIWKPYFWLQQKTFLIAIVAASFILWHFWEYTYGQKDGLTLIFNLIIHSLGILGIVYGIKFLAEIEVNTDIVKEIEYRGSGYLENLKNKPTSRLELGKLEQKILPNNQTEPKPAMIRLFQRIIMEAKDRQFESSVSLVQPYQDESYERMLQISNFQKLALRLGILGTFIGLIIAIKELANKGIGDDLTELIRSLFSSLYLAFSTSVAGLEVAILLGVLLSVLHRKQKKYFRVMEDAVLTMLSIARNAINKDEFLAEFSQVYNLMNELSNEIYDYNQSVKTSVGNAEQKIASLTVEIQQGLEKLSQQKAEFDGFLNSISDTQKQFIDDMKSIYDVISLKRISDELRTSIIDAGKDVSDQVIQTQEKINTQTDRIQEGIDQLSDAYREFADFLDEINKMQQEFIDNLRKSNDVVSMNKLEEALKKNSDQMLRLGTIIHSNANASLWRRLRRLF